MEPCLALTSPLNTLSKGRTHINMHNRIKICIDINNKLSLVIPALFTKISIELNSFKMLLINNS